MISISLRRAKPVRLLVVAAFVFSVAIPLYGVRTKVDAAACQAPSKDYGSVSMNVTIPEAATYRIWTRMNTNNTANNSYLLEVDGNNCFNVGGSGLQANTWTWISHRDGNTASRVDLQLAKGSHSLKLIGNKPGVKIDRLIFASDMACTPSSPDGSECNVPADTQPPTVQITAPAVNSTVSGTVNFTATATDTASGVTKVEFYINNTLVGTDNSSPYAYSWDTRAYRNESQLLEVRAYDGAGNVSRVSNYRVTVQNGDQEAPSTPAGVTATATNYNAVTVKWRPSTDNTGVTGYSIVRDGIPAVELGNVTTYNDTTVKADTTYTYRVIAIDAAGNKSTPSSIVSVTTPKIPAPTDTQPPTTPSNLTANVVSSRQIDLTWQPSADNTGVVRYDVYRKQGDAAAQKIGTTQSGSFGDASLSANTAYTYYVIAYDGAGNASQQSAPVTATTKAETTLVTAVSGVMRDQRTKKPLAQAVVIDDFNGHQNIYMTDSQGRYRITGATPGKRVLAYHAHGYRSAYYTVTLEKDVALEKNVTLRKR